MSIVNTDHIINIPQLETASPKPKEQPQKSKSWLGFFAKTGLSLTALGVVTQFIYNSKFSPSASDYNVDASSYKPLLNHTNVDCDSSAFKALQTFFNVFENSGSLYMNLGLTVSEPPGSLQAFAMDQNLEALDCAFDSYGDQITPKMKNKLLGKVLKQIQINHRDLVLTAKALLAKGANPNYQGRVSHRDSKVLKETTFTPLMTAYRTLDADFYDYLINRGASPGMQIHIKKKGSLTIIEAIIDDMKSKFKGYGPKKRLNEAYLCPIFKRIVDSSVSSLIDSKADLSEDDKTMFRVKTYMEIQPHFCKQFFKCSDDEVYEYEVEKLKDYYLGTLGASKDLYDSFSTAFKSSEQYTETAEEYTKGYEESPTGATTQQDKASESVFKQAFDSASETVMDAWNSEPVRQAREAADGLKKDSSEFVKSRVSKLASVASDAYHSEIASSAESAIKGVATGGLNLAGNVVASIATGVSDAYHSERAASIATTAKNKAASVGEVLKNGALSGADALGSIAEELGNGLGKAVEVTGDVVSFVAEGLTNVKDTVVEVTQDAAETAREISESNSNSTEVSS